MPSLRDALLGFFERGDKTFRVRFDAELDVQESASFCMGVEQRFGTVYVTRFNEGGLASFPGVEVKWWELGFFDVQDAKVNELLTLARDQVAVEAAGCVLCSTCSRVMEKARVAGRHFGGRFCEGCWQQYRDANKTKCSLCGRSGYECHC